MYRDVVRKIRHRILVDGISRRQVIRETGQLALISTTFAIMAAVQCVASAGGSVWVSVTTRSVMFDPSGRMREGRVLSRRRPSKPSCMKRSCQRQTQVFDLPVRRIISGANTVRAQQDDLSPPDMLVRRVAIPREHLQTAAISGLESDGNSGSHAPDSHASSPLGIPSGIQMSDVIH